MDGQSPVPDAILEELAHLRIAVVGDICLDLYHTLSDASEVSVETSLPTRIVAGTASYLGGAGNVAANLASLGVGRVELYGVVGEDLYGREVLRLCEARGIEARGLLVDPEWATNVYTKLYRDHEEEPRIDTGTLNTLCAAGEAKLVSLLERHLADNSAVIINQQIRGGIHTPSVRTALASITGGAPQVPFFLDSRDYPDEYARSIRKLNEREAQAVLARDPGDAVAAARGPGAAEHVLDADAAVAAARELCRRWERPVYLTRGECGCVVATESETVAVPALAVSGPVDTVGAGDSMLAGIACAWCSGTSPADSAAFGSLVAAVTVRKLRCAGVATPDEVREAAREPDYLYRPELARSPRRARSLESTSIEVVTQRPTAAFRYALFDHDGTISTVREGWEQVMIPMMVEAVLGVPPQEAPEERVRRVESAVRGLVARTTGIRTIVQMEGLCGLVREFGFVEPESVLSPREYKLIYNDRLMEGVHERIARFEAGELETADLTIKGSVAFLEALHEAGLTLFLASGTDEADTRREAQLLGYADLFDGGIYGSTDESLEDPKRMVITRILERIGGEGGSRIVAFGDGPVEIRETGRAGGYTVGVAADEVRRYGLDEGKRERLILAGADCIIHDYTQERALLAMLGLLSSRKDPQNA